MMDVYQCPDCGVKDYVLLDKSNILKYGGFRCNECNCHWAVFDNDLLHREFDNDLLEVDPDMSGHSIACWRPKAEQLN